LTKGPVKAEATTAVQKLRRSKPCKKIKKRKDYAIGDQVTINSEQALYVIPCGKGFTCLGFDVCIDRATNYARWLTEHGVTAKRPDVIQRGTLDAYHAYQQLISQIGELFATTNARCDVDLTPELFGLEGRRVEVIDKWGETRRFIVGKSTGFVPIHLEVKTRRSLGGVMGAPFRSLRVIE
jgi:hypothetical protein